MRMIKMIKRIEIARPNNTYNLHILEDHNYVAAGAVVANCHTSKAKLLQHLLTGPLAKAPIRFGLTGTIPKDEYEAVCLLAAIGPVVNEIRAAELQERGILASCQVEVIQTQDDGVEFSDYDSEHTFLVTNNNRLKHLADLIKQWAASGNTLVLVERVETGEVLAKLLPQAKFISGEVKVAVRQEEYKSIQSADDKITIATYGVASVGINIPRIFNLVLLECGVSFIRTIQSVGRALRRAHDKEHATIYDVCSSLRFSKRHLGKRKEYYREMQYPMSVTKIAYPSNTPFPSCD